MTYLSSNDEDTRNQYLAVFLNHIFTCYIFIKTIIIVTLTSVSWPVTVCEEKIILIYTSLYDVYQLAAIPLVQVYSFL